MNLAPTVDGKHSCSRRARLAGYALLPLLTLVPTLARAESRLASIGQAAGYATPAVAAATTSLVNGVSLAYGEGSSRAWRVAGYVAGGVELAIGAGLLLAGPEEAQDTLLAVAPLVLGSAAILTALLAPNPDDVVRTTTVVAFPLEGGGGIVGFSGRF